MESGVQKRLSRSKTFIAGGVCSGLADHYGFRKGGVQAAFVISSLLLGFPVLIYLILWIILPKEV
ncbi:PspC domain-containing protein [Endozoicomonas sp. G2_1]|uniref:PspC domain-containing protein n=1 Tax=Endozoicomonas sp. G2_1 TaxID=2821091 RepID=UPI001ADD44C9|nr:PspC domain-containing protein [Endozoicomonas sp. G2_1]MBO9491819.1 PspC domain-containing protein [Endozoicomonas sp. G2_1]